MTISPPLSFGVGRFTQPFHLEETEMSQTPSTTGAPCCSSSCCGEK
jgi:hypothetical protein